MLFADYVFRKQNNILRHYERRKKLIKNEKTYKMLQKDY